MKRIFHRWEMWECVAAGMYEVFPPKGMNADDCKAAYAAFLSDIGLFTMSLDRVVSEWPVSCEQFLSNENLNRVAWLGQASMCIETGVPSRYKGGFMLLSDRDKFQANAAALRCLNAWLARDEPQQLELLAS
jgi:hypothetical protein